MGIKDEIADFISLNKKFKADDLKKFLLSTFRPPFQLSSDADVAILLTTAINLSFTKPSSEEMLYDTEQAGKLFTDKVLNKKIGGRWSWLGIMEHLGTHHPKTQNDKVSSGPLIGRFNNLSISEDVVGSLNCGDGCAFSGAGNATYNTHYVLLSLAFGLKEKIGALIQWIAWEEPAIKRAFQKLGMNESQWRELILQAQKVLSATNSGFLDRQLKQILVPCTDAPGGYWQLTPLPSTRLITSFEMKRRQMREEGIGFPVFSVKIGGTKPQNAGSLPNELGGWMRHLEMRFPQKTLPDMQKLLYRIAHGRIFYASSKDPRIHSLNNWFDADWEKLKLNRQKTVDVLKSRINEWFYPQMEGFLMLSDHVSNQYDFEKQKSLLDAPEYKTIPLWLRTFLDRNLPEKFSTAQIRNEFVDLAFKALKAKIKSFDDSYWHLLRKALQEKIEEVL